VSLNYNYADDINLTKITDNLNSANTVTLGYSAANRLNSASGPWGTLGWTYDGVGNRLTQTQGATVDTTNYPSTSNKPNNITRSGSTIRSWTYDGAGNIATDVQSLDSFAYSYSKANRLAAVTNLGSPWATYKYNGLSQLASRTVTAPIGPSGTIQYIYDLDGHLIAEADSATGATLREYIWLDDLPVAVVANVTSTPILLMVHADHLKRPIRMTDATKATVWSAIWKPFGEPHSLSATQSLDARLPGQWFQIETGLAYNWHRHYDPTTGRYTQPDPLGLVDGPSLFDYAYGSPLIGTDFTGLKVPSPYLRPSPETTRARQCLSQCIDEHFGLTVLASGLGIGGAPIASKPRLGIAGGGPSRGATNLISKYVAPYSPRPTAGVPTGSQRTTNLIRAFGRVAAPVAIVLGALDFYLIEQCTQRCCASQD
jgi:RHS repeat-associated protein